MSKSVKFVPDNQQIKLLESEPFTRRELDRAAYQFAKYAAVTSGAPRRTGRGARSIRGSKDPDDPNARIVSWSNKYYWMIWAEYGFHPGGGTTYVPGRHFLRSAFEHYKLT